MSSINYKKKLRKQRKELKNLFNHWMPDCDDILGVYCYMLNLVAENDGANLNFDVIEDLYYNIDWEDDTQIEEFYQQIYQMFIELKKFEVKNGTY